MRFGKSSELSEKSAGAAFLHSPFIHIIIIAVAGLAAYANTFHAPFVFDDQSSITANQVLRNLDNFIFNSSGYDFRPRRFIGYLSFALNYRLGGLDAAGYHAVNLAVHITNALLVYYLVRFTLQTPFFRNAEVRMLNSECEIQNSTFKIQNFLPLLVALLFVVHPVQTQAVTYIVQRLTSLATMFYLLALVMYVRMRLAQESERAARLMTAALYILSLAAVVLAMKTKEIAFTLPIVLLLYEFSFFNGRLRQRLVMLLPFLGTLLIIPFSMLNTSKPVGELLSDVSAVTTVQTEISRWDYLLTQFSVITTYLRLLFLPVNQNLDHDYPIYDSFLAPRVFLSFLLLAALFGLAVYLNYRSRFEVRGSRLEIQNSKFKIHNSPYYRLIAFGIFWFFITLSVESSIIPIVDVMFEHRVYLPSIGVFVAVATACLLVFRRLSAGLGRKIAAYLLAAAILLLASATYQRNDVWGESTTLWEDVVKKSPRKARGYNNLGEVLSEAGRLDEAIAAFLQAITLRPDFLEAYNNLGAALSDAGRPDEAIAALMQAISIKPDHPEAYYNLGRTYLIHTNRTGDAVMMLAKAIELNSDYIDAYVNLAAAYNKMGNFRDSVAVLEGKRQFLGERADARLNLGVAYHSLGKAGEAARELAALKALDPQYAVRLEAFMARPYVTVPRRGKE